MMEIGKHKGRKDATRLKETVEKMKAQFSSLRKACASINILWTKFYWFTHFAKPKKLTRKFVKKLSNEEISKIHMKHMKSDEITFLLPDHKFEKKEEKKGIECGCTDTGQMSSDNIKQFFCVQTNLKWWNIIVNY